MRPVDYLRIVRRRWWVLLVTAVIASSLAFATRPSSSARSEADQPKVRYRATHTLISGSDGADFTQGRTLGRTALLVTTGAVPERVSDQIKQYQWPEVEALKDKACEATKGKAGAASSNSACSKNGKAAGVNAGVDSVRLGYGGSIVVKTETDVATGSLAITAETPSAKSASKVANLFAMNLLAYLDETAQARYNTQVLAYTTARDQVTADVAGMDRQLSNPFLGQTERDALSIRRQTALRKLASNDDTLANLVQMGPVRTALRTIESASPKQVTILVGSTGGSMGDMQRLLLGAAIGVAIGLAILLLIEMMSSIIRDVPGTEGAAKMPVVAEIPVMRMERGQVFEPAIVADPTSLMSEAYRAMRTSLLALWARHPKNHRPFAGDEADRSVPELRILLVTSPGPAEGKSTSAVNLAAAFAEAGQRVLVVDGDFRRPQMHKYFHGESEPNVGSLEANCTAADVDAVAQETGIPGVRFVAAVPTRTDPGRAVVLVKAAALAGKELADLVIVDSPPILFANDAAELSTFCDATVLMARAGWTRRGGVVAAADLLRRLEATVIGAVLVGAERNGKSGYYGYYGYYGYGYGYAHPGEVPKLQRMFPWRTPKPAPMVRPRPSGEQVPVGAADSRPDPDLDLTSED